MNTTKYQIMICSHCFFSFIELLLKDFSVKPKFERRKEEKKQMRHILIVKILSSISCFFIKGGFSTAFPIIPIYIYMYVECPLRFF